jgi:hypothetical protein
MMHRRWAGILLTAVSALFALLLAEALLRWVFHAAPLLDVDIYAMDADRLLRLRPGIRRHHVTRHWNVTIAINGEGFRDRHDPIVSTALPVLSLGDSFAFGWGVPLDQTYSYLVEERLGGPQPVRVVKAAVPGTGPGDQLRLLDTLWDRYQPQVVLLGFFVGNDFTDVQMGGADQFEVQDGLLIRRELRPPSFAARWRQTLLRSSHLLQFLRAVQLSWGQRAAQGPGSHAGLSARDPWLWEFAKVHLRQHPPETARGVAATLTVLDRFQTESSRHGADLVILVIPRSYQIYREELGELQSAFGIRDEDLDLDHPQRILREWARSRHARIVDLLPVFRSHHERNPGTKLYYYPDAHLNAEGHRVAAEALAAFFEQSGLPRRR